MKKFTNPLDNIRIASPCKADWNEMMGNERRKFCAECKLNVYNLSGMTRAEAENLLINSEGRVCVRFYRRTDGSIITRDCPVGWKALKQRVSKAATAFVSVVFGIVSGLGLTALFSQPEEENNVVKSTVESRISKVNVIPFEPISTPEIKKNAVMGDVSLPIAGRPVNLNIIRQQIKDDRKR
ncbi:MAG: hypothetical protein WA584_10790 [Pyrinomonadaceae bacterium]